MKTATMAVTLAALICAAILPLSLGQSNNASSTSLPEDSLVDMLIVGGHEVPVGDALYMTGLRETELGKDFCGGTLIADRFVLSAAHCTKGPINYVSIGTHYLSGDLDGVRVAVKNKFIHPLNNPKTLSYDFLVLELEKPVDTSKYHPVTLAGPSGVDIVDDENATVMGWGIEDDGELSNILRGLNVTVASQDACKRQYESIDSSVVCVRAEFYTDACNGDSGGPLIVKDADGSDVEIGVVSWGNAICGIPRYLSVFARVPIAADWINSVAPGVKFSNPVTSTPTPVATPTITPTPTTPSSSGADRWGQCGGKEWTGPTTCKEGTCTKRDDWYSQCI